MAGKAKVSREVFTRLENHLAEFGELAEELRRRYLPDSPRERRELEELLTAYSQKLEAFLGSCEVTENSDKSLPFAVLGSEVELQDLDTGEVLRFRLVTPFQPREENDVSLLSPTGKAVLLRGKGEQVVVVAPGGKFRYEVKSITYPAS